MGKPLVWLVWLTNALLAATILFLLWRLSEVWLPYATKAIKVLVPFFISIAITYLLHPLIEYLLRAGLSRTLSVGSIFLLFFGACGYGIYRGVPFLLMQVRAFSEQLPSLANTYRDLLYTLSDYTEHYPDGVQEKIWGMIASIEQWIQVLLNGFLDTAQNNLDEMLLLLMVPFIVFYLLKDYPQVKKAVVSFVPNKWHREGRVFAKEVNASLGSYIRGQLLVCAAVGGAAMLGYWIIGLQFPILLGVFAGLTNVIPYFGPIIGAVPALVVAFAMSPTKAVFAICVVVVIQLLESNVLSPLVVGKSLHMHPVVVIFVLLLAGEFFGLVGMVLAIPAAAVIRIIWQHGRNAWLN
ncbi:AI-2E family transporter [Aureibacillus halotolerans]|uniref:Putative PurR-regulated permease PerM n=1 Tax=Aureibacillus halotolerans TaxID=1508390 RepID=A0A4R6U0U7_9BACI|nr:AI-2E family transporter [Aureibacillus halotolerans]TDQ38009.1 putative PurR-regulated permease PerM [Aureibacillus halotolerans]